MNKKSGFIATSVLYSFFLVFIAILTALLSAYINNKTIMERFNDEVQKKLNTKSFIVNIYGINVNIQSGMTLTNLISNGTFSSSEYWNQVGEAFNYDINWGGKISLLKNNNILARSRLEQRINVLSNTKYYYAISYINRDPSDTGSAITYISNLTDPPQTPCIASSCFLQNPYKGEDWTRSSGIYDSTSDTTLKFVVGDNTNLVNNEVRFTEAMVVNLTSSFGRGFEPNINWLNKYIDYFDGTISFKSFTEVKQGAQISVTFELYENYTVPEVTCTSMDTGLIKTVDTTGIEVNRVDDKLYATVNIDNIDSNYKCNVKWSTVS